MDKREQFYLYYNNWREETIFLSYGNTDNKWFDKIREMGVDAVPYIYEILSKEEASFLVIILDELFPNTLTCEGYVPLKDICHAWKCLLQAIYETAEKNQHNIK